MFSSQRTREVAGRLVEVVGELLDRLARTRRLGVDGLGSDREDAARRTEAVDAVLDLAAPQGGDAQQGLADWPGLVRDDPALRQSAIARSSHLGFGEPPSYMWSGDQLADLDRPEGLICRRRPVERQTIVLRRQQGE